MVFFTCNHCGESVKKPSVEKHYSTKCRGAPKSISCMDCQKDFQENYVEHVKCISELQKYSGKDFVPRESANSGAKKQEGWVETVRAVLDSSEYELSKTTRQAFEVLQKYDNVPRKKAKFLNFVTNSVRIPRKTVEEVWNILEKEQEKLKQAKQKQLETAKSQKEQKAQSNDDNSSEISKVKKPKLAGGDAAENAETNGIKKKKKKHSETEEVQQNGNSNSDDQNIPKKKKKKDADIVEQQNVVVEGEGETKKKKKKAKSLEENDAEVEPKQNGDAAESKKKKNKTKSFEENDVEVEPKENGDAAELKKKKKKRAADDEESVELDTPAKKPKLNGETQKENKASKTKESNGTTEEEAYTFSWDYEFQNVMSKYADGLEVEKLKKKILKKYKTKFEAELNERQMHGFEKKFNKKLKKNNLFKLEGDLVKAVS